MSTDSTFLRQQDLLTPEALTGQHVDIVGCGALGGSILVCLAKMGFGIRNQITITDPDHVEPHNLATQWFRCADAMESRPKVEALEEMLAWICERELITSQTRLTGDEDRPLGPIVILAVDRLDERRRIWDNLKTRDDIRFLVDARMGAEVLDVYCVDMQRDDRTAYQQSLIADTPDERPYEEPCTRRAIFYTVMGGAAFVGSILRGWIQGDPVPRHLAFDFRNFFVMNSELD